MKEFFGASGSLSDEVTKPLSHIKENWELTWSVENDAYVEEDGSFAALFNQLIDELDKAVAPARYHDNEDRLAEYVKTHLNWPIRKLGKLWHGADYREILEQGGFHDRDEQELIVAAAGRIKAAEQFGQAHFDDMEESHRRILATVLTVILYHRWARE